MRAAINCLAVLLTSTTGGAAHGSVPDQFGFGSRSAAMSGAVTADADDFSAGYYNPAGIVEAPGIELSVGYLYNVPMLNVNGLDNEVGFVVVRRRLEIQQEDQGRDEQDDEDDDGNDGPGELQDVAAVDLLRDAVIDTAVAKDGPDDAGRDQEEDNEGDGEDALIEEVDVPAGLCDGIG